MGWTFRLKLIFEWGIWRELNEMLRIWSQYTGEMWLKLWDGHFIDNMWQKSGKYVGNMLIFSLQTAHIFSVHQFFTSTHVLLHQIAILSCQVKWSQTSAKLQPDNWIFSQFGLVGWILLDIYSQTLPCSWSLRKISAPLLWRKNSSRGGCNQEWGTNGSLRLDAFKVYLGLGKCRPGE